jgi:CelD/BcsL family acetyltransferase involved in cellulose biosynthesis
MIAADYVETPVALTLHSVWIESRAGFAHLRSEWRDLFTRARQENAFLTFGWMFTWWQHFDRGKLAVIAVRDSSSRLVAVAPFYIARVATAMGARRLGFLADAHVGSDYLDILADREHAVAATEEIARTLLLHRGLWDYIELRDAADSQVMAALTTCLERGGMRPERAAGQLCYYIPLPPAFEEYLSGIGISLRANFRRRWRNLQRDNQGECLTFTHVEDLQLHFPSLLALHRMRFQQREMHTAFLAPGVPEFHADALRSLATEGLARLFLLKAGGEPVAAIYGFSAGETFQFYQCGMHPEWMRQGVGQVMIGNAIEHAIAGGHTTFDFLRGGESYKAQWAHQARRTITWRLFDRRRGSLAAQLGLHANLALRRAAHILRAWSRRYLSAIRQH